MTQKKFDFSGYATRTGRKCTDGRVILKDAFAENHGMTVPLVWQHMHNSPDNVLGHATLENRDDGVYAFCSLNDSPAGQNARMLIMHGDITALSIYANGLVEKSKSVVHGVIREVSLVLSGANPGAVIDNVTIQHGDGELTELDDEAIIFTGDVFELVEPEKDKKIEHADGDETIGEIFETLSEKQKTAVYAVIANIMDEDEGEDPGREASAAVERLEMLPGAEHDLLVEVGALLARLEDEGAEARPVSRREVEEEGRAARNERRFRVGAAVAVHLARHDHPHLDLPGEHLRREEVGGVEHPDAAVQEVEGERAPAVEVDVDPEGVLDVAGDGRLADVLVPVDPRVHEDADVGGLVARGREAPLSGLHRVLQGAPPEEAPSREADAEALDAAVAHVRPPRSRGRGSAPGGRRE